VQQPNEKKVLKKRLQEMQQALDAYTIRHGMDEVAMATKARIEKWRELLDGDRGNSNHYN
jgi:hypothetical protein